MANFFSPKAENEPQALAKTPAAPTQDTQALADLTAKLQAKDDQIAALTSEVERLRDKNKAQADKIAELETYQIRQSDGYSTPLLALLDAAVKKFWVNADLDDKDTWQKKEDVCEWIKKHNDTHTKIANLSQKAIDSIDLIIRPEQAKTGGRPPKES